MPTLLRLFLQISDDRWQDMALSAGNIFFCFTLVPMLRHPRRPPLLTCIPTGVALLVGGLVFATLHLWLTALTQTITGLQWLALALKKSHQSAPASPSMQRKLTQAGAIIALLTGPAAAQDSHLSIPVNPEKPPPSQEEIEKQKAAERAYGAALQKIPDKQPSVDPWGNVRPSSPSASRNKQQ